MNFCISAIEKMKGGIKVYTNLSNQLRAKGLSWNAAAAAIGMPEPTFRGKMTVKERSFSIEEAIKIKLNLFPEMDMMYLFKKDDVNASA